MNNHSIVSGQFLVSIDVLIHKVSYAIVSKDVPKFKSTCGETGMVDESKGCHGVVFIPFSIQVYTSASTGGKKKTMRRGLAPKCTSRNTYSAFVGSNELITKKGKGGSQIATTWR
jgi:hypothetical protein